MTAIFDRMIVTNKDKSNGIKKKITYLTKQFLVDDSVALGSIESLLEERKQHRDDDYRFESLSKDDKENWNGEDASRHFVGQRGE